MFVDSQNIVEGNYLFLKELQKYNILSNIFYFIGLLIVFVIIKLFFPTQLEVMISSILFFSILRFIWLRRKVNKNINNKVNNDYKTN